MSEPIYKLVNGEVVPMTPEEQAEFEASLQRQQQTLTLSSTNLDMGKTINEILQ